MFNNSTFFIGLDLGDKQSHIFVLDPKGEVIEESRLPTNPTSLQRKFASFPRSRVAMEVGAHSRWASQLLKDLGHEVRGSPAFLLRRQLLQQGCRLHPPTAQPSTAAPARNHRLPHPTDPRLRPPDHNFGRDTLSRDPTAAAHRRRGAPHCPAPRAPPRRSLSLPKQQRRGPP